MDSAKEFLIAVPDWTAMDAGTDVVPTAAIDFTAAKDIASATRWKYVMVQAHDGTLLMTISKTGSAPATPNAGTGLRIVQGTPRIFGLPKGVLPAVRIIASTGTVLGSVFFGGKHST